MRTLKIIFFVLIVFVIVNPTAYAVPLTEKIYLIKIKISEKTLILLENGLEINRYPVATPRSNWYSLPLKGEIIEIEDNPIWYPTAKTRIAYFKKKGINLPAVVSPNNPKNAMGKVKFVIRFKNFNEPIRLHGTNDPFSIGKRITRGCIRMYNEDALELAKIIEKKLPVPLIIEK